MLDYVSTGAARATNLDPDTADQVIKEIITWVNKEFDPQVLLGPDETQKQEIKERIGAITGQVLRQRKMDGISIHEEDAIRRAVENRMLGLGFLEELLPPARTDLSEIMVNPDGSLWTLPKGAANPVREPGYQLKPDQVRTVVDKILGAVSRRVSEAEPIVSARLPRSQRLPAGARVNVVAPPIANGRGYHTLNIRLYEEKPVTAGWLLERGMLNQEMMDFLADQVAHHARILIGGGTATGKTTLLSCLAGFIPDEERVVLVEDPAEIFIDHPHVVSMEARPPTVEGKFGVGLGQLVTTAMRQSPRWLVVGEVRTGDAAVWLLRAQMSDHPGLSTIHAHSPRAAVDTLCLLARLDLQIPYEATKNLITRAIDLAVQIGYDRWGVRRVTDIGRVEPTLKHGNVLITPIYGYQEESSTAKLPVWQQVGQASLTRP